MKIFLYNFRFFRLIINFFLLEVLVLEFFVFFTKRRLEFFEVGNSLVLMLEKLFIGSVVDDLDGVCISLNTAR